jgi:hypothetical protein
MSEEIKNTSIDRNLIIETLPSECKKIGKLFFKCLHFNVRKGNLSKLPNEQYLNLMEKDVIPRCMAAFNLEECLGVYNSLDKFNSLKDKQ